MDLSEIKPVERMIDIIHPSTGEEVGLKVTVVSIDDERLKRVKRKIQDESIRLQNKNKSFKAEDIEDNRLKLVFAAMTSWQWVGEATFHGEKPEFNLKNVKELFKELPWVQEQIENEVSDQAAFFTI